MRHINIALKNIVGFLFLALIGAGISLALLAAFGGLHESGLKGMALGLGGSLTLLGLALIGMLFLFSLICPLLEIAENTRILRDSVQSGALRVIATKDSNPVTDRMLLKKFENERLKE